MTLELLKKVIQKIENPKLRTLAGVPLRNPRFLAGYGARKHHHAYLGGLLVHTSEVVNTCLKVIDGGVPLRYDILITAAFWHDYLKIRDYSQTQEDSPILATKFHQEIYHITGGAMEFYHQATLLGIEPWVYVGWLHIG